jgi:hypothetical protein
VRQGPPRDQRIRVISRALQDSQSFISGRDVLGTRDQSSRPVLEKTRHHDCAVHDHRYSREPITRTGSRRKTEDVTVSRRKPNDIWSRDNAERRVETVRKKERSRHVTDVCGTPQGCLRRRVRGAGR